MTPALRSRTGSRPVKTGATGTSRGLDDDLEAFPDEAHRFDDLGLGGRDDRVDVAADDGEGAGPSELRRPSAIVFGSFEGWIDALPSGAGRRRPVGLDADDPGPGGQCLHRQRGPGSRPPPPTGRQDQVEGPGLFDQLHAAVAWPAITRQSSYGWIKDSPWRSICSATVDSRAASVGSQGTTRAPYPSVAARLTGGAVRGITTQTGMPSSCPASATACAWLPDECVTTPAARSASLELQQGVHRPPELERTDPLEVLALQQHRTAGPGVQGLRLEHGGPVDPRPEPLDRLADLVAADRRWGNSRRLPRHSSLSQENTPNSACDARLHKS